MDKQVYLGGVRSKKSEKNIFVVGSIGCSCSKNAAHKYEEVVGKTTWQELKFRNNLILLRSKILLG